jgi:glycine oxidase
MYDLPGKGIAMSASGRSKPDAIVIGGGIAGLSCAHALAGAGLAVTVYEMAPGRGASWAAAGMLSPWAESPHGIETCDIREHALAAYPEWVAKLADETGLPLDVVRCGSLVITESEDEQSAPERLSGIASRAPGFRSLSPADARAEAPLLGAETGEAVLLPEEGYADPPTIVRALTEACRRRGVIVREEPVLRLIVEEGCAVGVSTPGGDTHAGAVLDAAGAWAGPFLRDPEVRPIRGQLVALRPAGSHALRPGRIIQSTRGYIVPRNDGSVVIGGTSEDVGFETGVTAGGLAKILSWALRTAPSLCEWRIGEVWSGFRPLRPKGIIAGPDEEIRRLFHATGQYRHGILLAPSIAERIREAMVA